MVAPIGAVDARTGSELVDAPRPMGTDRVTSELLPGREIVVAELFRATR